MAGGTFLIPAARGFQARVGFSLVAPAGKMGWPSATRKQASQYTLTAATHHRFARPLVSTAVNPPSAALELIGSYSVCRSTSPRMRVGCYVPKAMSSTRIDSTGALCAELSGYTCSHNKVASGAVASRAVGVQQAQNKVEAHGQSLERSAWTHEAKSKAEAAKERWTQGLDSTAS